MSATIQNSEYPQRPPFTKAQEIQALYVGSVTDTHRRQRPAIRTHTIDDLDPNSVPDRDDGIFVEVEPNHGKGYAVHVTIADVAAHVRPGSPLANAAWQRAFTVYKPGSTDSMFPKILQQNLSLEHNQERLGLTVNITLDENFKPIHTSFTPVITTPDNTSYAEAHTRIKNEPQFELMAKIAEGIRHKYSAADDAAWNELNDDRRKMRGQSDGDIKAMHMVATYMLLANNCVGQFFHDTGLPFIYRNFDGSENNAHAQYSTEPLGHSAVKSMGMKGAYCHFTSPIRRGSDYFNGIMVHYAVNVLTEINNKMRLACPFLDEKKLNDKLWKHGSDILKQVALLNDGPENTRANLRSLLQQVALESAPEHNVSARSFTSIVGKLHLPPVPLTKPQLDTYAQHMNALAHSPQMAQIGKLNEKYEDSQEIIERISGQTKAQLSAISLEKFSSILQAAAITGEMPTSLFDETMTRLSTGNFDRIRDGFALFLQAQYPSSERWRMLKREIARVIKNDPGTVNELLKKLEQNIGPNTIQEQQSHVPGTEMVLGQELPARMISALLVMNTNDGSQVAAPFYSVGHDKRAALSHARYSFLEHYAFTELQPIERTAVPNLLYADLDMPGTKKYELFERMVQDIGAELVIHAEATATGNRTTITVGGGDITVPITTDAEEPTEDQAFLSALRRMLRHDAFKIAVSRREGIGQSLLNPQTVLAEELAERGGSVDFSILPAGARSGYGYCAVATVRLDNKVTMFTATEPNIDRAKRVAAALALESLGTEHASTPLKAASWASLATQFPPPGARYFPEEHPGRS